MELVDAFRRTGGASKSAGVVFFNVVVVGFVELFDELFSILISLTGIYYPSFPSL